MSVILFASLVKFCVGNKFVENSACKGKWFSLLLGILFRLKSSLFWKGAWIVLRRQESVTLCRQEITCSMPRGFGAFGRQEKRHEKSAGGVERENSAPENGSGPMKKRPRKAARGNGQSTAPQQSFRASFDNTGNHNRYIIF